MERPRLLVQELTRLQKRDGYLTNDALVSLATKLQCPLYQLQEVASFYPHFRTEVDGPPPQIEVHVCQDMTCNLRGSNSMIADLGKKHANDPAVAIEAVSCLGRCDRAPAVIINDEHLYVQRTTKQIDQVIQAEKQEKPLVETLSPDSDTDHPPYNSATWEVEIDIYRQTNNAYSTVARFLNDKLEGDTLESREARLIKILEIAGLLGMGGAGGRTYKKWNDVCQAKGDMRYVVCNADESEPGTFKDREILLRAPHLVLEGMILGALTVGANQGYVYVRHEYVEQIVAMQRAIDQAKELGYLGPNILGSGRSLEIEIFVSPGGYICGEKTALIEALENKRAEPRNRPPELETNGLYDCPTLLNNVETFAWIPAIVEKSGRWFRDAAETSTYLAPDRETKKPLPTAKGRRFYSISGDVESPGVYEVPCGITLRELVDDYASGVVGELKAVALSGPSGGFLPRQIPATAVGSRFLANKNWKDRETIDVLDLPLDISAMRDAGLFMGAGIVIYNSEADLLEQAYACSRFYAKESCGKCVPCRLGSAKTRDIADMFRRGEISATERRDYATYAISLDSAMKGTSICGLGQVASSPLLTLLKYFPETVDARTS